MRIAHLVSHSLVRYTPARIATYWGRYTEHEGRAIAFGRGGKFMFAEPLNPYGFYCSRGCPKAEAVEWLRSADVIHCHDDAYPSSAAQRLRLDLNGKVLVYHAHIGSIPERYFPPGGKAKFRSMQGVRHAAITNGYGHIFDAHTKATGGKFSWGRLPDILDLDHPTYAPDASLAPPLHGGPLLATYTYSNHHEGNRVNAKRPRAHRSLIARARNVECSMVYGRSFDEAMAYKKMSHVVIEECFSDYLHLSALEGAACGRCVVTKFDQATVRETSRAVGAPESEWPFLYADFETLPKVLEGLDADRDKVAEYGARGLAWMRRYYNAPRLLQIYLDFYGR